VGEIEFNRQRMSAAARAELCKVSFPRIFDAVVDAAAYRPSGTMKAPIEKHERVAARCNYRCRQHVTTQDAMA